MRSRRDRFRAGHHAAPRLLRLALASLVEATVRARIHATRSGSK